MVCDSHTHQAFYSLSGLNLLCFLVTQRRDNISVCATKDFNSVFPLVTDLQSFGFSHSVFQDDLANFDVIYQCKTQVFPYYILNGRVLVNDEKKKFVKKIIFHTDFFHFVVQKIQESSRDEDRRKDHHHHHHSHHQGIGGHYSGDQFQLRGNIRGTTSSKVRESALGEDRMCYDF